jgi:hypothetical protein
MIKWTLVGVASNIKIAFLSADVFQAMYDLCLFKDTFPFYHWFLYNELWNLRTSKYFLLVLDLRMQKWATRLFYYAIISEFAQYAIVWLLLRLIDN